MKSVLEFTLLRKIYVKSEAVNSVKIVQLQQQFEVEEDKLKLVEEIYRDIRPHLRFAHLFNLLFLIRRFLLVCIAIQFGKNPDWALW